MPSKHLLFTLVMVAHTVVQCVESPVLIAAAVTQGESPSFRSFRSLVNGVAQIPDAQLVRELRIELSRTSPPPSADVAERGSRTLALIDQRVVAGRLRRERFPQLSQDRLVVVVQDAAGGELDWRLVPNPALVRAEVQGPDGRLQGRVLELDNVELSIAIPAIQGAHEIQLYRPYWNGDEYLLEPFGQVQIQP